MTWTVNPVPPEEVTAVYFLAVYLLMIIGIAIPLAITWRLPSQMRASPGDQNEAVDPDRDDGKER